MGRAVGGQAGGRHARFDSLESDVAEINLKLTALIAHLNATEAVDAALEGRLTGADTEDASDQPR